MQPFLDFLNNNAGLVAILGVIVGWALSSLTSLFLYRRQKKDDAEKEIKERFKHKAELDYDEWFEDNGDNAKCLEVILCTYEASLDKYDDVDISYPSGLKNIKNLKKKYYYFENIGESDINELEVAVSNPKMTALLPVKLADEFLKDNVINYRVWLDEKIRKGEALELVVYYLEKDPVLEMLGSTLEIYYRDSLNNTCRQSLLLQRKRIYEPIYTTKKEWQEHINVKINIGHWYRRLKDSQKNQNKRK